jgi:hypothetical protein
VSGSWLPCAFRHDPCPPVFAEADAAHDIRSAGPFWSKTAGFNRLAGNIES